MVLELGRLLTDESLEIKTYYILGFSGGLEIVWVCGLWLLVLKGLIAKRIGSCRPLLVVLSWYILINEVDE